MMSKNIIDYFKVKTLEDKANLIDAWEEDRGADGEYVYDLDVKADAWAWAELYGIKSLYECRNVGRYWLGGWQYRYKDINPIGSCICECWNINDKSADSFFAKNLAEDIEERYTDYISDNAKYQSNEETIKWINKIYRGLIDFEGFATAIGDIKPYSFYTWIAKSNDESFTDESWKIFSTMEECYNNMRDSALEKMKWNTEWSDVADCKNEPHTSYIGYEVAFNPNYIEHSSYSGIYRYDIVRCNEDGKIEKCAWETLDKELGIKK